MSGFTTELLDSSHDRNSFKCGVLELDAYLRHQASQDMRRKVAAVYVLTESAAPTSVIGFYTLSSFAVETVLLPEDLQRKLPRYPLTPATLIGRIARDLRHPGVGRFLLMDALRRVLDHSKQIASAAVVVDVKNDSARKFYTRYGFIEFAETRSRMFISMKTVASAI